MTKLFVLSKCMRFHGDNDDDNNTRHILQYYPPPKQKFSSMHIPMQCS